MCRGGSSISSSRRRLLAGAGLLGLSACGFRPLYGPQGVSGAGAEPGVAAELAATRIGYMGERFGQLMRRELAQRMAHPGGAAGATRYELRVAPGFTAEVVGYLAIGSATRVRYVASALWSLHTLDTPPEVLARGTERTIDAYDVPSSQFFAADLARDATERRMAAVLADEVVTRLAMEFRQRLSRA